MNSQRWHLTPNLFALTLLLSILCGCGLNSNPPPTQENIDKSFMSEDSCALPCWHGLIINQSTREDVIATLNSLPFVEHNTYKEYATTWVNEIPATEIQFSCASDGTSTCGGVLISENILRRVWTVLEYNFTIKDAVEKLGSPEFLEYEWPSLSGKCSLRLVWVDYGVTASVYDDRSYNECESIIDGNLISSSLLVDSIAYSSFDDFGELGNCCHRVTWPGMKAE
jgi:hypothetical protein